MIANDFKDECHGFLAEDVMDRPPLPRVPRSYRFASSRPSASRKRRGSWWYAFWIPACAGMTGSRSTTGVCRNGEWRGLRAGWEGM